MDCFVKNSPKEKAEKSSGEVEKDEGQKKKKEKRKGEVEKDVRVRGKRKKKKKGEGKVFFGSVCGSQKTVEIIEWCEVKTVAKRVGIRKLGYFKWWVMSD